MSKKANVFKIITGILLGLCILWCAIISTTFYFHDRIETERTEYERFGIKICGEHVRYNNAADLLGSNGAVVYNKAANTLVLHNAVLECEDEAIISEIDLTILLIGENKIVCRGNSTVVGIYASENMLRKDIFIYGDGSLEIVLDASNGAQAYGIVADNLNVNADVTVTVSDTQNVALGIECNYLSLLDENALTVSVGSAAQNAGILSRTGMDICKNAALNVTSAAAQDSCGIQCMGNIVADSEAAINAVSGGKRAGIVCYGALIDRGAQINAEVEAIGGVHSEAPAAE